MMLVLPVLRTVVGLIFVVLGVLELGGRGVYTVQFAQGYILFPFWSAVLAGAVAIAGGAMFALGIWTRLVGVPLALLALGAVLSIGRAEGGWYLGAAALLVIVTIFFAWRSGRQPVRSPARRPGAS